MPGRAALVVLDFLGRVKCTDRQQRSKIENDDDTIEEASYTALTTYSELGRMRSSPGASCLGRVKRIFGVRVEKVGLGSRTPLFTFSDHLGQVRNRANLEGARLHTGML